jgi:hypothetical protein
MGDYLKLFNTHSEYEEYIEGDNVFLPNVSHCKQQGDVHYNPWTYAENYLTFVAKESGTISFNIWYSMGADMITSISYSTDDGETWTTTANQNNKQEHLIIDVNVNEGDKVIWKGIATQMGYLDEDDYGEYVGSFFSSDCEFDAKGNVMSLLYGDDFKGETTIEGDGTFCYLFSDYDGEKTCHVVNAKDLSLPATTLASSCYQSMFYGCTSLVTVPELPAIILANGCYSNMFYDCTSLTTAPVLPAETLAKNCYSNMFYGCTKLTKAPELPATTLAESCYGGMFQNCTSLETAPELSATTLADSCYVFMFNGCTSLTTAPELPATTLADSCYVFMFQGCTSLTTAPELPATTLADSCYGSMFNGCTSLNYIKAMFTTTPDYNYTSNWVYNVASSGTFVKNSAATWNVSGVNGIPNDWTVETANP